MRRAIGRCWITMRSNCWRIRSSRPRRPAWRRSEEHTSELQPRLHLVCRLLLEKKKAPLGIALKDACNAYQRLIHADPVTAPLKALSDMPDVIDSLKSSALHSQTAVELGLLLRS